MRALLTGLILLALALPAAAQAPPGIDLETIPSPDPDERFAFGGSVAVSGDILVASAVGRDGKSVAAYVFVRIRGRWILEEEIPLRADAPFVPPVALSGDTLVIGMLYEDAGAVDSGAAYVYVREGGSWRRQARLVARDGESPELFGSSVAVDGETLAVGAIREDDAGVDGGAAYVFRRIGAAWVQEAKLSPRGPGSWFGKSVSLDRDTLAVGAPLDGSSPGTSLRPGSAYVFVRRGLRWVQQARLTPPRPRAVYQLGETVSLSGDTLAVGAYEDRAYTYVRQGDGWRLEATITQPPDPEATRFFGFRATVSGNLLIVPGAVQPSGGLWLGAYLYVRWNGEWIFLDRLAKIQGGDIAIAGDTIALGSPGGDEGGDNAGAVFVLAPETGRVDLNVGLLAPQRPIEVNRIFAYRARVTNQGPVAASGVSLTIDLPGGVSPQSVLPERGGCARSSDRVVCRLGILAPGESVRVIVRAVSSEAGSKTATAAVSGARADADPSDDTARAEVVISAATSGTSPALRYPPP
ncbi:MAG TPA: hypothetical protein VF756_22005 [Thermoanaerobaculia bacterium]